MSKHNIYSTKLVYKKFEKNLELSDKVILPEKILQSLTNSLYSSSSVDIFKLETYSNSKYIYCGVLEYTAKNGEIYIPDWLASNLDIKEDDKVRVTKVSLPKISYVELEPCSDSMDLLNLPSQKAILSMALSRYTVLTQGSRIRIEYNKTPYYLTVKKIDNESEQPGGCIVDIDLMVDLVAEAKDVSKGGNLSSVKLLLDKPFEGSVSKGDFQYFEISTVYEHDYYLVLVSDSMDCDIYVSCKHRHPSIDKCEMKQNDSETPKVVLIKNEETTENKIFFISVTNSISDSKYTLNLFSKTLPPEFQKGKFGLDNKNTLRDQAENKNTNADQTACENCGHFVRNDVYQMHLTQCKRNVIRCETCSGLIKTSEARLHNHCKICGEVCANIEKHSFITHQSVKCDCGDMVEAKDLNTHKLTTCELKTRKCKYCDILLPSLDLVTHLVGCEAKTGICDICSVNVKNKQLVIHKALEHNINPCLESYRNEPLFDEVNLDNIKLKNIMFDYELYHDFDCPNCKSPVSIKNDFVEHINTCAK